MMKPGVRKLRGEGLALGKKGRGYSGRGMGHGKARTMNGYPFKKRTVR